MRVQRMVSTLRTVGPVIADLVSDESHAGTRTIHRAPPPDAEAIRDSGSIMDMNLENADE
jgi:hypothetical protein